MPGIFICYRRADSSGYTGRLYDRLSMHFGENNVFMDVDDIEPGQNWIEVIEETVGSCDALIAVIGPRWLEAAEDGRRRIDSPDDRLRKELVTCLRREIRVFPALVGGARMPVRGDLPDELGELASWQALEISDRRFGHDLGRLIDALQQVVSTTDESPQPDSVESPRGGYELVAIPGGKYLMGSPDREEGCFDAEGPVHAVTVPPFFMGRNPVTNAEYARFLEVNRRAREPENWSDLSYNQPRQPVVGISWGEAWAYCEWAGLRLPSEAEWEHACRAGTRTRYWSGDTEEDLARVGWYDKNSGNGLHHVGEKPANPFGLLHMHGNVYEWCEDTWHDSYDGAPTDGSAWIGEESGDRLRVIRGGCFWYPSVYARSAYRLWNHPDCRYSDLGLRSAKTIAR